MIDCTVNANANQSKLVQIVFRTTGTRANFQAAIGLISVEKASSASDDPLAGYGIGVDDVKFERLDDGMQVTLTKRIESE